jgi:hypothetical protein
MDSSDRRVVRDERRADETMGVPAPEREGDAVDDLAFDADLDQRLSALVARAPASVAPVLPARSRQRALALAGALGAVLAIGIAATASGAAEAVREAVVGVPGIENAGQPLHGADLECMAPPQAAAFLAAHGYVDVVWQVESGDGSKGGSTPVQGTTPPTHGYVIPGAVLADGRLHMLVDERAGATGVGACAGEPMP